jgi:uncharacterized membrane protein YeaQ/YmgE (transglycosylase-associated protein family)
LVNNGLIKDKDFGFCNLNGENFMELIWFILIGLVAGAIAGRIVQGSGFGTLGDIVVGILGAVLGGFLFSTFGISSGGGLIGSLIVATIGAVVLLYGIRLVNRAS